MEDLNNLRKQFADSIGYKGDFDSKEFDIEFLSWLKIRLEILGDYEYLLEELDIDFNCYKPKDIKGKEHLIGLFEADGDYDYFIEQGAKKYAYIDSEDKEIHIVVSGVPKKGRKALKDLKDFRDDFVFDFKDTNKLMLMYNDIQEKFELEDYQGNIEQINDKYGCCLVPITYKLSKSLEYSDLLNSEYSERARYKE